VLTFAVLGGAILGSLGVIAGIWADKFDQLAAFQNFLIMPLTMLSGVFYSIHSLPVLAGRVAFQPVLLHDRRVPLRFLRSIGHLALAFARRGGSLCFVLLAALTLAMLAAATSCVRKGFQMFQASEIKRLIEQGLPCEFLVIEGDDGVHFSRHRRQRCLRGQDEGAPAPGGVCHPGPLMGNEIHALQLQTFTPAQWEEGRGELGHVSRAWTNC
jgi:acid stress-induced BolA-like protein IbaG/YrbA